MNRIPQEKAEAILRRAIEFDADEKNTLSVEELHAIAKELNISARAVELALRSSTEIELEATPAAMQGVERPSVLRPLHMAVAGVSLMIVAEGLHIGQPAALGIAFTAAALYAVAQNQRTGRVASIIRGISVLWGTMLLTSIPFEGLDLRVTMPRVLAFFVSSCAIGLAAAGLKYLTEEHTPGARGNQSPPSSGGGGDSWRIRALKKIAKWLPGDPMNSDMVDRLISVFRAA